MEDICEEITDLQKKGRYDPMYQKAQLIHGTNQGETDSVKIGRGVRQRCCMSPILFKIN